MAMRTARAFPSMVGAFVVFENAFLVDIVVHSARGQV